MARFTGDGLEDGVSDGPGEWLPLTRDGRSMVPGFSLEEVLVFTRLAADAVGATKMDRPEDVEPNLHNGRIYVACTNNTDRGKPGKEGPTEPNPRGLNKDGHVVEISPRRGDHTDDRFAWNLLLICGDPDTAGTYFGGYEGPVSPIACPDNVAFDSTGTLWVSTDGQPGALGYDDGLFKVTLSGDGARAGPAVPVGADRRRDLRAGDPRPRRPGSVFVAVQHPGEDGTWEAQQSHFPDFVAGRTAGAPRATSPAPVPPSSRSPAADPVTRARSGDRHAAVDGERLAGDVAGGVGGQEDDGRRQLPRVALAARGDARPAASRGSRAGTGRSSPRRRSPARRR